MQDLKEGIEHDLSSSIEGVNHIIKDADQFGFNVSIIISIVDGRIELTHELYEKEI